MKMINMKTGDCEEVNIFTIFYTFSLDIPKFLSRIYSSHFEP